MRKKLADEATVWSARRRGAMIACTTLRKPQPSILSCSRQLQSPYPLDQPVLANAHSR